MSAKQAKRLRQAARGLAVSLDQAGRKIHERGLVAQEHRRASPSSISSKMFSSDPKDLVDDPREGELMSVTALNRPDSLRGIVRTLKKGMKKGTVPKMIAPTRK